MSTYNENVMSKLYRYFTSSLQLKKSTGGWYRTNCIYCGGKHTVGINFATGSLHCFKCDERKNLINALMDMENLETFNDAWSFLKLQEEYEHFDRVIHKGVEIQRQEVTLPESFKLLNKVQSSLLGKCALKYLTEERHLKLEKLSRKGIGWCSKGDYANYIIFPMYEKGKLVFYQGRKFNEMGHTKMKNPDYEKVGIGKSELLYNPDALYIYKTCYLVESIINAETIGERGVGFLGKPSEIQIRKIINSPVERVVILLDPDAIEESITLAMVLSSVKQVKLVTPYIPELEDVNSLGKKKTIELVNELEYQGWKDFYKLKLNLNESRQHTYN